MSAAITSVTLCRYHDREGVQDGHVLGARDLDEDQRRTEPGQRCCQLVNDRELVTTSLVSVSVSHSQNHNWIFILGTICVVRRSLEQQTLVLYEYQNSGVTIVPDFVFISPTTNMAYFRGRDMKLNRMIIIIEQRWFIRLVFLFDIVSVKVNLLWCVRVEGTCQFLA